MNDYACVTCSNEYGVGFWTRDGAGPFCDECWKALCDPDQALLTERRLAATEAKIELLLQCELGGTLPKIILQITRIFGEESTVLLRTNGRSGLVSFITFCGLISLWT